jgi:dihydrodipicolinate synthase/N-acetylneuraminate lyase
MKNNSRSKLLKTKPIPGDKDLFGGVIVPILTFFDEKFNLDLKAQKRHTDFLIGNGVKSIFIMGSAGEGVCLCDEDKVELTEKCAEFIDGRARMLAGISQESLPRVKKLIDKLKDFPIDAFVVTLPYYFPVSSHESVKDFFKAVADYSPKPIFVYNIPCFTKVNISPETVGELSVYPNIVGVKDSHSDLAHVIKLIRTVKTANPAFKVFIGEESLVSALYGEEFDGIIPIYGNIFPSVVVKLFNGIINREPAEVVGLQSRLNEGKELISSADSFFAALKAYLSIRGTCSPFVLPPIRSATHEQMLKIKEFYNKTEPDSDELNQ